jgi:hypothetical protein
MGVRSCNETPGRPPDESVSWAVGIEVQLSPWAHIACQCGIPDHDLFFDDLQYASVKSLVLFRAGPKRHVSSYFLAQFPNTVSARVGRRK